MSDHMNRFVVVAIERNEARVWATGVDPKTEPERIYAPTEVEHRHVREAQHHRGHDGPFDSPEFYESITNAIKGAAEILVLGHGTGKANAMVHLIQYWERKHPDVAAKVIGAVDSDLEAMTEGEVLAKARLWFKSHRQ